MNESGRNGDRNEDREPIVNCRTSTSSPTTTTIRRRSTPHAIDTSEYQSSLLDQLQSPLSSPPLLESKRAPPNSVYRENLVEVFEGSHGKDPPPPPVPTSPENLVLNLKSDLTSPKPGRHRKKSEEGRKPGPPFDTRPKTNTSSGKNRKQSGIPVGIAVAWQRHVTTSGTSSHTTTNSYVKHHHQLSPIRAMSSPPLKVKRSPASPKVSTTPVPLAAGSPGRKMQHSLEKPGTLIKTSSPRDYAHSIKKLGTPEDATNGARKTDNGKNSDFGSDIGRDRIPASNNNSNSGYFSSAYGYSNPYGDWTSHLLVPNSSQQSYNAMVAAYMQQLSMQSQLQYGYNNHPYVYGNGAYTPEQIHQYEQLVLQQQRREQMEMQQDECRRDYDLRYQTSTPIPAISPRISIPSPSPNSPQCPPYGIQSPWASDMYHQHHPLALVSSATLSPRSLASSTPSPITTYESLSHASYLHNRKCLTPNPPAMKPHSVFNSPFSPPSSSAKDWDGAFRPMSLVTHRRKPSVSPVAVDAEHEGNDEEGKASLGNPCSVESIPSNVEKKSVDFSRLESLIEKRGEASVRLLAHTPPPTVPRSKVKKEKRRRKELEISTTEKAWEEKAERESKRPWCWEEPSFDACDGNEMKVPELVNSLKLEENDQNQSPLHNRPNQPINNRPTQIQMDLKFKSMQYSHQGDAEKYFLPIELTKSVSEEKIYPFSALSHVAEIQSGGIVENGKDFFTTLNPGRGIVTHGSMPGEETEKPLPVNTTFSLQKAGIVNNEEFLNSNCDSESVGACNNLKGTSPSDNLGHSFPKIVISSEEDHLSLLATVAQEIGPYISMNPNPGAQPRRFENLDNIIQIEEGGRRLSSDTSSTTSSTKATTLIPSITQIKLEKESSTVLPIPSSNCNNSSIIINEEVAATKISNVFTEKKNCRNMKQGSEPFQLKIPQVIRRIGKEMKLGSKSELSNGKEPKLKKRKKRGESEMRASDSLANPLKKPKKEPSSISNKPKPKLPKKKVKDEESNSQKRRRFEAGNNLANKISSGSPKPLIKTVEPKIEPAAKVLESIYDFEAEDLKPPFETFKHCTTTIEKFNQKSGKSKPKMSLLSSLNSKTWSPLLNSKDLSNSSPVQENVVKKFVFGRVKDAVKVERPVAPRKRRVSEGKGKKHQSGCPVRTKSRSPSRILTNGSCNLDSFLSASLNTDSNASLSNDSVVSSAWTANPIHAVTAVKIRPDPKIVVNDGGKKLVPKRRAKSNKEEDLVLTNELKKLKVSSPNEFPSNPVLEAKSSHFLPFSSPQRKKTQASPHHIKPSLKAEPIVRTVSNGSGPLRDSEDSDTDELLDLNDNRSGSEVRITEASHSAISSSVGKGERNKSERLKIRKPSIDMNIFSRRVKSTEEEKEEGRDRKKEVKAEPWNENVVIGGVEEMIDEMRVLTEIQGLFYTGKLNALQPPDVYGVTLDNERGAPPHIIFSAEEVLEKCIREAKPWEPSHLPRGLRICAYWSPMYSGLYPGRVSSDYDLWSDLVPVEFDDGDTGIIKICEIRLLAPNHPVREYDPNPLLTLEKKQRKRRHSSAARSQNLCTGDHEEDDCGESYCAKIAKLQEVEADEEDYTPSNAFKPWTWSGLPLKYPKNKQNRNKEFFGGIQRGDEIINIGDSAIFISDQQNRRPFLGRVEKFWEKKGMKNVTVRWFYHPEEAKTTGKRMPSLKYPGGLFESPHTDDNDVQTIAKKCEVLPFKEFREKYGHLCSAKSGKSHKPSALKGIYYVAGNYNPFTCNLTMADLK